MIIESVALDWLTLSEPHDENYQSALVELVRQVGTRQREGRRLGYLGYTYTFLGTDDTGGGGSFFHGQRDWKGKTWDLLIASGESAHWLIKHIWKTPVAIWAGVRCTRLDTQVTIPWPSGIFYLRHLPLTQKVKATVVHGISEGDEWAETLYLGARASPVLVRAYRKRIDKDERDWLRVEVEYKREASKRLFWILLGERYIGNWFQPVLDRCEQLYDLVEPFLDDDPERPLTRRVVGKTFKWLSTTVANCVCRLLADDDQGDDMAELVAQWYAYSQSCQKWRNGV